MTAEARPADAQPIDSRTIHPGGRWRPFWSASGWALLILGLAGILGWLLTIRFLVQPLPSRAPIRPAGAVGLFFLGGAALGLARGWRRLPLICAILAAVIGVLGITELVLGMDVGLERMQFRPDLDAVIGAPGSVAVPLSSAWGLLLGGAAMVVAVLRLRTPSGAFIVGVLASILVALSIALILAQSIGLSRGVQFGPVVGSGPQAAIGLLGLGLSLAASAWSREWAPATYPAWVPPAAGLASLTAVLFLWRAMVRGQSDDSLALLGAAAERAELRVNEGMGRLNSALRRVGWFSFAPVVGSEEWRRSVQDVVGTLSGLAGIAWVDSAGRRVVMVPTPADSLTIDTQLRLQIASHHMPPGERPDSTWHFSLADSAQTLGVAVPRCDLQRCQGYIVGLAHLNELLEPLLADSVDGYHRSIAWRGRSILASAPPPGRREVPVHRASLSVDDMAWELQVWPINASDEQTISGLPGLVLAFGLLVTGLLPVSLQLGRTLQSNARTAEVARLQVMLGRSMDRAWSWEVPGRSSDAPSLHSTASGQEQRLGNWTELLHPEDRQRVEALLSAHLDGWTPVFEAQYRVIGEDGEWHWRVDRGHVTERGPYGTPLQMLGVSGDVSERRRVDQARDTSDRRFQAMFESAYQFQSLLDLDCRILEANLTALELLDTGTTVDSLRGTTFWEAAWWRGGEGATWARSACEAAREGRTVKQELEIQTTEGRRAIMDFSVKPIRDSEGKVTQLLVEGRDVTARRRAEAELREVETLTTMGRIAARVAHEINNPLAGIQNSFLLLRDAIPPDHPHFRFVGAIEREIRRIADVTRQLYETYRPDTDGAGQTGVRTLIGDAVAFLQQVNRPSKVQIEAELTGLPSLVPIPESVLRQSVYNLVQNAVEASPVGGKVWVGANMEPGHFVLRVKDQGPGIAPELRQRIFEPFVTSKGRAVTTGGMGIGLSLVRRSVEAIGGSIEIADPPEGGAEFVIRFPVAQATNGGIS